MKPSEYIKAGWCQGNLAQDASGKRCDPYDPPAIAWCLLGAIRASLGKPRTDEYGLLLDEAWLDGEARMLELLCAKLHPSPIAHWNDAPERTQAEAIRLLEELGL